MKKYILAIDEGTTSIRIALYDVNNNKIIKIVRKPINLICPKPDWVEIDPEKIWNNLKVLLKKITNSIDLKEIYAMGIANQRETIIAWDKITGKPLYNAIVWKCQRTKNQAIQLKSTPKLKNLIYSKTGLIPNSYFSATKIQWLLNNINNVKKALKQNRLCIGTVESYLVFKLTEGRSFVTDVTNASRTMLFNIKTLKWDDQLLKLFNISKAILPNVVDNDSYVGITNILNQPIKIIGLIGDQQSSLLGQGCINKGMAKNTYGTGCFLLCNIGKKFITSKNNLITTIAYRINNQTYYALEGSIFNAGSLIDWAIKNQKIAKDYDSLITLSKQASKNNDCFLIPGLNGLGAPYWSMGTNIKFIGSNLDKKSKARAVCESLSLRVSDIFLAVENDLHKDIKSLRIDGGLSQSDYLMQMQANILQTRLDCVNLESTCMGAIFATCLGCRIFKNINAITSKISIQKSYNFIINNDKALLKKWKKIITDETRIH